MKVNGLLKVLEPGDVILYKGVKFEIRSIRFQEYWGEKDMERPDIEWGFYVEFRDTNGIYRNWKQFYDGGEVLPKNKSLVDCYNVDCSDLFQKDVVAKRYVNPNGIDCSDIFKKYGYC